MNVDDERGVCKHRSRWRSVVSAYLHGKTLVYVHTHKIIDASTLNRSYGAAAQTMAHLISCPLCPIDCVHELIEGSENAILVPQFWADSI